MTDYTGYFNDKSKAALEKAAAEAAQLAKEVIGWSTGKEARHLASSNYSENSPENGGKGKKRGLTALDIILMQSSYDESYKAVMNALANAEIETETAIESALQAYEEAKAHLTDIQSRAATLPDGTRVYRDEETGLFHADDDTLVDPETTADIEWNAHNATRQENIEARKQVHETGIQLNIRRNDQVRLGEIRNEMDDLRENEDHDQLKGFELEIDEISERAISYIAEKGGQNLNKDPNSFRPDPIESVSVPPINVGG